MSPFNFQNYIRVSITDCPPIRNRKPCSHRKLEVVFRQKLCYTASRNGFCKKGGFFDDELDLAGGCGGLRRFGGRYRGIGIHLVCRRCGGGSVGIPLGAALWLQIALFLAVSVGILAAVRPLMKRANAKTVPTNLDRVIGCTARVTEEIDNEAGTGAVYVEGKTWTARSSDGTVLPIGTRVIAERMEGVKLYVKPEPISSTRQS